MKSTILLLIVMGLLSIGLAGCGNDKEAAVAGGTAASTPEKTAESGGSMPPAGSDNPGPSEARPEGAQASGGAISAEDLLHRRFVLESVDGQAFPAGERVPELEFLEGLRVAGAICNRFIGQGKLEDGVLTVDRMASTKMLCIDEALNSLEGHFAAMMQEGVRVKLDGNSLTLTAGEQSLGWTAKDWVR